MSGEPDSIPCPICKKPVKDREDPQAPNRFFPFCGDRCRLIDLGRWLDGVYQVPAHRPDTSEDSTDAQ